MRKINITSILNFKTPEKWLFFEGWSWFKYYNLGLALGTNLKFCSSVEKGLKLNAKKFWRSNHCRSYMGKTGRGAFLAPPLQSSVLSINIL